MRTVPDGTEPATTTLTAKVTKSQLETLRAVAHRHCRTVSEEVRWMLRQRFEGPD